MLYSVPEVGTSARLAIMKCLMRPLLPRSLEDIQVGYEKDVENRMAQERYEEFVQKEGFFSKAQLEKEATRWGLSPSGTREELESQISDQYFSCLR